MEKIINIVIDGKAVCAKEGQTVLKAAADAGIEIPTLCQNETVKVYGACGLCVVEAEGIPKLLRACSAKVSEGMVIHTHSKRVDQSRKIALELLMSDHEGDCVGPCSLNCPAHTDCQEYVKQIALGNDKKAVEVIKERIPLPRSIGRVCPHPCETACRRKNVEQPISICSLKAFAADKNKNSDDRFIPEISAPTVKTVGIIGGGPGGLTAAYFLALKGHKVTVYDMMPKMGGMLRYGIPEYRLPKAVLDEEIADIASLGVEFKNNFKIGKDASFDDIKSQHDAVIVAIGAWKSMGLRCGGADLSGVYGGIDFLEAVALKNAPEIGKSVAVVGGGNTAMDACRTAVRLGAEKVYVVYRRTRAEMPAEDIEIEEAMEEGVEFKFLTNPDTILGENGRVTGIKLQVMELGEPDESGRRSPVAVEGKFEQISVDSVISALGQRISAEGFDEIEKNARGNIAADEGTYKTNLEGVFAVGDATNKGAFIAIDAIGEAGRCAGICDAFLHGVDVYYKKPFVSERRVEDIDFSEYKKASRAKMPTRPANERKKDFGEVALGFSDEQAREEAKRCLECGCHDYGHCKLIKYANDYPVSPARLGEEKHPCFVEHRLNVIERNQGKCILCGLCVRICDEVAKQGILGLVGRGFTTVIKPEFNKPETIAICASCKKCAEGCPTGALKIIEK